MFAIHRIQQPAAMRGPAHGPVAMPAIWEKNACCDVCNINPDEDADGRIYASGYNATERDESSQQLPKHQTVRFCCNIPRVQLRYTWFSNQNQRPSDRLPGLPVFDALCAHTNFKSSLPKEIRKRWSISLQRITDPTREKYHALLALT